MSNLAEYINQMKDYFAKGSYKAHYSFAINQLIFLISERVFNSEQGSKDVKGKYLGDYSAQYKVRRQAYNAALQVVKKDLNLSGDLQASIKLFLDAETDLAIFKIDNSSSVYKGESIANIKKAEFLTKQNNDTPIFKASQKEIIEFKKLFLKLILNDIRNAG